MSFFGKKKDVQAPTGFSSDEIESTINSFIAGKTTVIAKENIQPDTKLFSSGLLDSLAYVELVSFIETKFKVRLSDAIEVNVDNMDTPHQLVLAVVQAQSKAKK